MNLHAHKILRLLFFIALFICINFARAAELGTTPAFPKNDVQFVREIEGIREFKLANGLQLLLVADGSRVNTTVNIVYKVGASHESYGKKGMAHLLEHLTFQRNNLPNQFVEYKKRNIQVKGSTSYDFTNYKTDVNTELAAMAWVFEQEAKRMREFNYTIENLQVVRAEVIGEKQQNDGWWVNASIARVIATMFVWDAYGRHPIGIPDDLNHVTLNDLREFWERYYCVDNATLIVAGKFDEAEVLASIVKSFGSIQKSLSAPEPVHTLEPVQDGEREIVVRKRRTAAQLLVGYRAVPISHPDSAAVMLLANIFGNSEYGRLQKALVMPKIAKRAGGHLMFMEHAGVIFFSADQEYGQDIADAKFAAVSLLENIKQDPITQLELDQTKQKLQNDFLEQRHDTGKLAITLSNYIGSGDWRLYFLLRNRIQRIDRASVQRIAESWFIPANRTLCVTREDENLVLRAEDVEVDLATQLRELDS